MVIRKFCYCCRFPNFRSANTGISLYLSARYSSPLCCLFFCILKVPVGGSCVDAAGWCL